MKTVAIAGVGLIGGSFALAVRKAGFDGPILGVSSPATIAQALDLGIITKGVSLQEACERADLIYLAQPIQGILTLLPQIAPHVRPGTLITDAGSTKALIVEAAATHIRTAVFIGGHPMAGKEVRGPAAAEANLFGDRPYILTPANATDLEHPIAVEFVNLLRTFKARITVMDAATHDHLVARTSHLPQAIATALGSVLAKDPDSSKVAGPAIQELTRLAQSPFDMWRDIFVTNTYEVTAAIDDFIRKLQNIKDLLQSEDLRAIFAEASEAARSLRK